MSGSGRNCRRSHRWCLRGPICKRLQDDPSDHQQGFKWNGKRVQTMTTNQANPNQALWEKGDFTRIAGSMRESGEALVGTLGVTKGKRVLDLGCGDGTTAVPEARLGGDVLGVDIARNLVDAGNRRARQQGIAN